MSSSSLSRSQIDSRITFHKDDEIMEVSFENLTLSNSIDVNAFYDRIEERVAETGEGLWFFLVNYSGARIDNEAWFAFSRRGKELNLAHSMASVRFDASEFTQRQIARDANTETFDPNLFADRTDALRHLQSLPSKRRKTTIETPNIALHDLEWRITFLPEEDIMDVNFSNLSFEHTADVNFVYDFIDERVRATQRKWFFLVNYEGTQIQSAAWVQYARRGKALNERWSLGSVRYAPGSETETDIRLRAESQDFRPNIRNTRAEAMERIAEMKAAAGSN